MVSDTTYYIRTAQGSFFSCYVPPTSRTARDLRRQATRTDRLDGEGGRRADGWMDEGPRARVRSVAASRPARPGSERLDRKLVEDGAEGEAVRIPVGGGLEAASGRSGRGVREVFFWGASCLSLSRGGRRDKATDLPAVGDDAADDEVGEPFVGREDAVDGLASEEAIGAVAVEGEVGRDRRDVRLAQVRRPRRHEQCDVADLEAAEADRRGRLVVRRGEGGPGLRGRRGRRGGRSRRWRRPLRRGGRA
mmetsp:Transcript_30846/g.99497  ORF Transcript_30846/g.99497 Transcript_30846/m.99497 type:complete len:249 (+) Transcript_30846:260-1006(+)